jgi:hypothetical protein
LKTVVRAVVGVVEGFREKDVTIGVVQVKGVGSMVVVAVVVVVVIVLVVVAVVAVAAAAAGVNA